MDEVLRRLTALEAVIYTLVGLHIIQLTIFVATWSIVIQGRRLNIPQLFDLTTKAVKRGVYALDVKLQKRRKNPKDKDLLPLPVFDEVEFRRFCRELLAEVRKSDDIASVPVTEAYWKSKGWGREQFVAFRERLERAGIIRVVDDRGKRGWMQTPKGYAGAVKRLEDLTK